MRWLARFAVLALAVLSYGGGADARELLVSCDGRDSPECGTAMSPCQTIAYSVGRANDGDTLVLSACSESESTSVISTTLSAEEGGEEGVGEGGYYDNWEGGGDSHRRQAMGSVAPAFWLSETVVIDKELTYAIATRVNTNNQQLGVSALPHMQCRVKGKNGSVVEVSCEGAFAGFSVARVNVTFEALAISGCAPAVAVNSAVNAPEGWTELRGCVFHGNTRAIDANAFGLRIVACEFVDNVAALNAAAIKYTNSESDGVLEVSACVFRCVA